MKNVIYTPFYVLDFLNTLRNIAHSKTRHPTYTDVSISTEVIVLKYMHMVKIYSGDII